MSRSVYLTVPMPRKLARLRFPKVLNDRLHHLLTKHKALTSTERKQARALEQLAGTLVSLKRGARITAG